jgi:hypothetical protein
MAFVPSGVSALLRSKTHAGEGTPSAICSGEGREGVLCEEGGYLYNLFQNFLYYGVQSDFFFSTGV